MFGIKFAHFDSMLHVIVYKNGKIRRQGRGLSFYYFAPTTSIVAVPVASSGLPFIFSETTKDYQAISIQGQVTYRIDKPARLADVLDFTVDHSGRWKSNASEKLEQTIINEAQTAAASFVHNLGLKEALLFRQQSYRDIDWRTLMALFGGRDPRQQIALGFRMLAENAEKIGTLNISPDLLESLITERQERRK